jgi:hypothetical protein
MASNVRSRSVSVPLILLCLGLAALLYYLAQEPLRIPPPATGQARSEALPGLKEKEGPETLDLASLEQTAARPLFADTRRPPEPESIETSPVVSETIPETPKVEVSSLDHTLVGIFATAETKLALLRSNRRGKIVRVGVGDMVDGWTVTKISTEQVELEQSGETRVLVPKPAVRKKPTPKRQPNQRRPRRTAPKKEESARHSGDSLAARLAPIEPAGAL